MRLNIRKAKPGDLKTIQRLNNEFFSDNAKYDRFLNRRWSFSKIGITYYKKALSNNIFYCLIAEVEEKPVGLLIGKKGGYDYRKCRGAAIDFMAITPGYRSHGIGTKLVREFKKWCRHERLKRLYVNSYYTNLGAIKFFKRQGLLPIDISLEGRI